MMKIVIVLEIVASDMEVAINKVMDGLRFVKQDERYRVGRIINVYEAK